MVALLVDGLRSAPRGRSQVVAGRPPIETCRLDLHGRARCVTVRGPRDGVGLERTEEAKFRGWSKATAFEHPFTAKILGDLADSYRRDAVRYNDDAERLDWGVRASLRPCTDIDRDQRAA
jgi:hypothetical protein